MQLRPKNNFLDKENQQTTKKSKCFLWLKSHQVFLQAFLWLITRLTGTNSFSF